MAALGLVGPALVGPAWRRLTTLDGSVSHRDAEIGVLQQVSMLRVLPVPAIDRPALHVEHAEVLETTRKTTVHARTSLHLYTLDGRAFLQAVGGYSSSGREADSLVSARLGSFTPAR